MLYELVMKYDLYGQECNNRFYYSSPAAGSVPGGAEDLTGGFEGGSLVLALKDFWTVVSSVDFHTITTRALYDDTDFFEATALGIAGVSVDGEAVGSATALGFSSERFRTGRNRGYKRFSGFGENKASGNTYVAGVESLAVSAALDDLVTGTTLGNLYGPRVLLLNQPSPGVYELYATEAEQRLNMSPFGLVWGAKTFLTTQRSRLQGHGI